MNYCHLRFIWFLLSHVAAIHAEEMNTPITFLWSSTNIKIKKELEQS